MKHAFHLADIGEGLEEAEIVRWLVEVGDTVRRDDPIVEIMTDKSNAELPAPAAGVIVSRNGSLGDIVRVGDLLAVIDDDPAPVVEQSVDTHAAEDRISSTSQAVLAPVESVSLDAADNHRSGADVAGVDGRQPRIKASPATRRQALQRGIDLATITGTGPGGRILLTDLDPVEFESAEITTATPPEPRHQRPEDAPAVTAQVTPAHERTEPPVIATPPPTVAEAPVIADTSVPPSSDDRSVPAVPHAESFEPPTPEPEPAITEPGSPTGEPVPLRGIRRLVAQNMARSWFDIPHIHAFEHIDAEPMLEFRERLKTSDRHEYRLATPLTFFAAAVVAALRAHPEANASINMADETITYHPSVHLGIAVAASHGLVVPVLANAETLDFAAMAGAIHHLVERARGGLLERSELSGGTATLTNFGSLGGEQATPLIRPPEAVIVGFGSVADRPFVIDREVVARKTMHVVLGADHRLIDGDVATSVLHHITAGLTDPLRLFL